MLAVRQRACVIRARSNRWLESSEQPREVEHELTVTFRQVQAKLRDQRIGDCELGDGQSRQRELADTDDANAELRDANDAAGELSDSDDAARDYRRSVGPILERDMDER